MEVMLIEPVPHLGDRGDIVNVAPGYARNYLLPKGLAAPVSKEAVQRVEAARRRGGWRAVLMGLVHGLLTLIVGGTLVAAFGGAMLVQSGLFDERHGQVTQTNYQAVVIIVIIIQPFKIIFSFLGFHSRPGEFSNPHRAESGGLHADNISVNLVQRLQLGVICRALIEFCFH